MKLDIPDKLSTDDLLALELSLYHIAKSASSNVEIKSSAENLLVKSADNLFCDYLAAVQDSFLQIVEIECNATLGT